MVVIEAGQCCYGDDCGGGYLHCAAKVPGDGRVWGREGRIVRRGGGAASEGNNLCRMGHKLGICGSFLGKISPYRSYFPARPSIPLIFSCPDGGVCRRRVTSRFWARDEDFFVSICFTGEESPPE